VRHWIQAYEDRLKDERRSFLLQGKIKNNIVSVFPVNILCAVITDIVGLFAPQSMKEDLATWLFSSD
jgi:uncharacterized membrane protein